MQRVTRSTAVAVQPAAPTSPGPAGFFTPGNPGGGIPATIPGYEWFNAVQEELVAPVLRAGLTPDVADQAQLRKAMDRLYGGGLRTVTANTTLTADDAGLVLINAAGGAVTVTLPAASAANARPIRIDLVRTDTSANTVTIQRAGSDTIEGALSVPLAPNYSKVSLLSDGASLWHALMGGPTPDTVPPGSIIWTPFPSPPAGYLRANGALVSRATYRRLFLAAESASMVAAEVDWPTRTGRFGAGDGSTTFRLPDLRGEFLRAWDDGRGIDGGRFLGTTQAGEIQSHSHTFTLNNDRSSGALGNSVFGDEPNYGSTLVGTNATGGAETRPRNVALLACIKF
jgi:hypothetical protein